ncbi:MAG: tRNA 2'-O-methylase [Methanoregula sp. PtaU1.Bin051]|nr:MAG: tRNA 2'-O-methylase [Methanoregula sp. PtaU1.Bin051]
MPNLPEDYEILLREHGCDKGVIEHCRAVTSCALELSKDCPFIDRTLAEAGAMLHDIGRGSTHSIGHAQAGAELCRALGITESVARIVECHIGAGLTADECSLLNLLPRECLPTTAEEKLVAHADNLIAGSRRVTIHDTLASAIYLNKKIRHRIYRLALDVEILCHR